MKAVVEHILEQIPNYMIGELNSGRGIVTARYATSRRPDQTLINTLLEGFPGIWLKNEWYEEMGEAGVIVGKRDAVQTFSWTEGSMEEMVARSAALEDEEAQEF